MRGGGAGNARPDALSGVGAEASRTRAGAGEQVVLGILEGALSRRE